MAFNILEHLDRLTPDGGASDPKGDHSFHCPVCEAANFKVNIVTGKWGGFSCDCTSTEAGKRRIRDAISPAVNPDAKPRRQRQERHWDYFTAVTLELGEPAITVNRWDDPDQPDGKGWKNGRKINQTQRVAKGSASYQEVAAKVLPYRLAEANQALDGGAPFIFWPEGESCCDALWSLGLPAITNIGGSGTFRPDRDGPAVTGIPADRLVVCPDRDKPGLKHAEDIAAAYPGCQWLYAFPGTPQWNGSCPPNGGLDIADWIAAGATVEQILAAIGPQQHGHHKAALEPVAEPSGAAQGGTSEPSGVVLAENRKALKELRGLAKVLLQEKVLPHERVALLRTAGHERGFSLRDGEILAIAADARRALQGKASAATPEDEFDIPAEVWAWDQVIAARTPNLLVALQKVGKTALMAGLISSWSYGTGSFLGHELSGPCPPVIIAGTDQTMADWRSVLAPAGLMQQQPNGKWKLCGPIVRLWHRSQPVYLDMAGIEEIAAACEQHPGALLLCDTYAALTAPLGLDEAKPEAAEPLYNLMEMVEPFGATPVLLHHASKSRANERASNASRNSNAIPAAVSQIISLQWLEPERKSDQRINLTTEGRNSKPVDLVIEQVDRSQWVSHGSSDQIKEEKRLAQVEANLTDRQAEALDLVRDAWERHQEMDAPQLVALMPDEFDCLRKARATLQQLFDKELVDKRTVSSPEAGGTVIRFRPAGSSLVRGGI